MKTFLRYLHLCNGPRAVWSLTRMVWKGLAVAMLALSIHAVHAQSPTPFTYGDVQLFEFNFTPPPSSGTGCWFTSGSTTVSLVSCSPAAPQFSLQYNNSGAFGGSSNLLFNPSLRNLTISGIAGSPALISAGGWIQSQGGFLSVANAWNGIQSPLDGALIRGLHVSEVGDVGGSTGGYININRLDYGNQPVPLNGLASFGPHTALLWVSGQNGAAPDVTYGLNTNLFVSAAGGFATSQTAYNAIQAFTGGGMFANSFTAVRYVQTGTSAGPPTVTLNDQFHPGALYWDTGLAAEQVYNGTSWVGLGGGGGGGSCPGGVTTTIQYNNAGACGGSTFMYWTDAVKLLTVTALDASHAGIAVGVGFMQADKGFLATSGVATAYNSIQAPTGGFQGKSFTASAYLQSGHSTGAPSTTSGDSFHAGALYWDDGSHAEQVYNGSAWVSLGGGSGTPGGADTNVQFNSSGSFAGSGNMTWNNGTQLFNVIASGAGAAGINVQTGFIQSAQGLVVASSGIKYNVVQAPSGGMAALSFTAGKYVQVGTSAGAPAPTNSDTFHAGTLYWDTGAGCLEVYIGSAFACTGGGGGGGVTSLNALTGGLSIAGTTSEIVVTPSGSTITLATPQPIATSSTPTFANVIATTTFQSQATGSSIAFQIASNNFLVDGNGNVSAAGIFNSTGGAGGFNVTGNTAVNSIQTVGGVNVGSLGSVNGGYSVHGIGVIDSTRTASFTGMVVTGNTFITSGALILSGGVILNIGNSSFLFNGKTCVLSGSSISCT